MGSQRWRVGTPQVPVSGGARTPNGRRLRGDGQLVRTGHERLGSFGQVGKAEVGLSAVT